MIHQVILAAKGFLAIVTLERFFAMNAFDVGVESPGRSKGVTALATHVLAIESNIRVPDRSLLALCRSTLHSCC